MTIPTPTPETHNLSEEPGDSENTTPTPAGATGFFQRVRQKLKPEPIHPSEAAEIVIIEEADDDR